MSTDPKTLANNNSAKNNPFSELKAGQYIDAALSSIQSTQVNFSMMADNKANIMITLCSLLLSLCVSQLDNAMLKNTMLIFSAFASFSLITAILTVIPESSHSESIMKVKQNKDNLINPFFFMHFSLIELNDFEKKFADALKSPDKVYRTVARDIYFHGKVLNEKKFRYLRWSYLSLVAGIIFSFISLLVDNAIIQHRFF